MAFYVLDENKNLVASFDREGFLAILQQAIEQGTLENIDPDSAVASKLRSNLNGTAHYIEFVTAAQYSELEAQGELVEGTYYFITDDTTEQDLETAVSGLIDTTDGLTNTVQNLVPRVGAVETGKLDKSVYDADFFPNGDVTNWELYDTFVGLTIPAGLYICIVTDTNLTQLKWACVPFFISSTGSMAERSAFFYVGTGNNEKEVYLTTGFVSGGGKRLIARKKEDDTEVYCFIYLHKIGGTV